MSKITINMIRTALTNLGYKPGTRVAVQRTSDFIRDVFVNDQYIGKFDIIANTFVD